jgi:hypothetical protein
MPPQCAYTVTEQTKLRRHWGRIYVPLCVSSSLDTKARLNQTFLTRVRGYWQTFYEACYAADAVPVVVSHGRKSAFSIQRIQIDDIPDVMRSRRWRRTLIRERAGVDPAA